MPDSPGYIPAQHVILPWAPYSPPQEARDADRATPLERDKDIIKVSAERLFVDDDGHRVALQEEESLRRQLDPKLMALGLPAEPYPSIPEADRGAYNDENLVSLAVALDILTTMTEPIEVGPTVLQQLCLALVYVGELGGVTSKLDGLLEYADSPAARDRARLSQQLALCVSTAAGKDARSEGGTQITPSTPHSVADAMGHIEATARLVVREAILLMQAHEPIDYWQA